ncbi:MAG: hypothetical protein GXY61_01245 [Lentisphaerae bacterium]|nr:hypothetical protein [Lentisphaerota bacterium]
MKMRILIFIASVFLVISLYKGIISFRSDLMNASSSENLFDSKWDIDMVDKVEVLKELNLIVVRDNTMLLKKIESLAHERTELHFLYGVIFLLILLVLLGGRARVDKSSEGGQSRLVKNDIKSGGCIMIIAQKSEEI